MPRGSAPRRPIWLGYCPQNHRRHPALFCQNVKEFVWVRCPRSGWPPACRKAGHPARRTKWFDTEVAENPTTRRIVHAFLPGGRMPHSTSGGTPDATSRGSVRCAQCVCEHWPHTWHEFSVRMEIHSLQNLCSRRPTNPRPPRVTPDDLERHIGASC